VNCRPLKPSPRSICPAAPYPTGVHIPGIPPPAKFATEPFGGSPGNSYTWVELRDNLTVSLLQARLIELNLPINVEVGTRDWPVRCGICSRHAGIGRARRKSSKPAAAFRYFGLALFPALSPDGPPWPTAAVHLSNIADGGAFTTLLAKRKRLAAIHDGHCGEKRKNTGHTRLPGIE
jgi:hypothetical protein